MTQTPDSYHLEAETQTRPELTEQEHLGILSLEISVALSGKETLYDMLTASTETMVRHLAAPLARIWLRTADEVGDVLELWASSGPAQLDARHMRIPIQSANNPNRSTEVHEAVRIAIERKPRLLSLGGSAQDASENEQSSAIQRWAREQDVTSFAGYPLLIGEQLVGVLEIFTRRMLSSTTSQTLATVCNGIALGIERQQMLEERTRLLQRERRAHIAAEIARQRLHDLFMQAPAIICVLRGPQHIYELANPPYIEIVGRQDIIGKTVREASPEMVARGYATLLDQVYTTGEAFIGKEQPTQFAPRKASDGGEIYFNFVYQPTRSDTGEVDGIMIHAVEVTEQVRARENLKDLNATLEDQVVQRTEALNQTNQELQRSNNELQEFAYVASHDLQEPLRKIQAFGNLLEEEYGEVVGEGKMYIERMRSAATRMRVLIDDLLAFSRVTTKAQPLVPVDLNAVAQQVVDDLGPRLESTQGSIELGELPTINADPQQMYQMLQNLLGNAVKFHKPDLPPLVKVSAELLSASTEPGAPEGENVERYLLHIEDNGIGFDEKYTDRIFTVFQRLHGKDRYEGTGIGLAVVRKIVERHNGTIIAHSSPGQGATFLVTLPGS